MHAAHPTTQDDGSGSGSGSEYETDTEASSEDESDVEIVDQLPDPANDVDVAADAVECVWLPTCVPRVAHAFACCLLAAYLHVSRFTCYRLCMRVLPKRGRGTNARVRAHSGHRWTCTRGACT